MRPTFRSKPEEHPQHSINSSVWLDVVDCDADAEEP